MFFGLEAPIILSTIEGIQLGILSASIASGLIMGSYFAFLVISAFRGACNVLKKAVQYLWRHL